MNHGTKQELDLNSNEFQPRKEFILVKPVELKTEKTSAGGIVIPQQNKSVNDRPTTGEVISVGEDITDISEGDFIVWPSTDGIDFEMLDGDFMLLKYNSVIGKRKNGSK